MPKRLRDLTRAQQDFIEGYINGICSFVARGPRGESVRTTERQFEECKSMMYEDEEKLVDMGEDWLQGIVKVFAPPPAVYDYFEWRQIKPAEPEEIVPMRGMRMMGARQESEEIRRRRREALSGGRVQRSYERLDMEELTDWVLNDESLYNWALREGVPVDEVGDEDSAKFMRFMRENRQEISSIARSKMR